MSANIETSGFVGRVLGGRWVVGEQLGSGTFGVVHAGVERGTGQPVAVKLLHPQFLHHGETIARFWNEAEALRRLDHPNVLTLLDVGVAEDGIPYLVTELLTGETLRDLLNREGALPPERAMRLLGPAAHALHHAHLAGIVHRDLKPENIFRVRKDGMGTTKILDFGMAKLLDTGAGRKLSQTGVMIGTMAYSPPEQMQGLGDIDHRADQFGFAALVFEALTGQRPFPQAQPFALFQAILSGPRPRATAFRPDLPPAVDTVLARALDPDREQRFANVEQFYLALSAALSGQPLTATMQSAAPAQPAMQPTSMQPSQRENTARFRAIDEERTRSEHADAHTTLQSGSVQDLLQSNQPLRRSSAQVAAAIPGAGTTLMEGRPPSVRPPAGGGAFATTLTSGTPATGIPPASMGVQAATPNVPSYRPPPSSMERPIAQPSIERPVAVAPPSPAAHDLVTTRPATPGGLAESRPAQTKSSSFPWWIVAVVSLLVVAAIVVLLILRH